MDPKIIFEDKDLLVLDKASGMIVNRADTTKDKVTLQDWVEKYLKLDVSKGETSVNPYDSLVTFESRAGIVHRLDKETSGIILVAKNLESFVNLQAQFKERKVEKTYIALAHGKVEPEEGEISVSVGRLPWNRRRFGVIANGRESVTQYKTINSLRLTTNNEQLTLLELYPKSGRTHQLRVHLQYVKHPIFADPLYAGRKTSRQDRKLLSRIFLHATKISFFHPQTNKVLNFESRLPEDLNKFLESLKS